MLLDFWSTVSLDSPTDFLKSKTPILTLPQVKLEAVQLYEQLAELEEQYNALLEEEESKLNPEQEREKLLLQIKNDNYEISNAEANMQTVENQIKEAEAQLEQLNQVSRSS